MDVCVTVEEILRTDTEYCSTLHSLSASHRTMLNPKVLYCAQKTHCPETHDIISAIC